MRLSDLKRMVPANRPDTAERAAERTRRAKQAALAEEVGEHEVVHTEIDAPIAMSLNRERLPFESFRQQSIEFLEATRLMLDFRLQGIRHPEWQQLEKGIPAHLREPVVKLKAAERAERDANWELQQAQQGIWYGERIKSANRSPVAAMKVLKRRFDAASARLKVAVRVAHDTAAERNAAEASIITEWLRSRTPAYQGLRDCYADSCRENEVVLTRLNRHGCKFHGWKATSMCAVLLKIADDLLRLLSHDEVTGDYLICHRLQKQLGRLDREAWEDMNIELRAELAALEPTAAAATPLDAASPLHKKSKKHQGPRSLALDETDLRLLKKLQQYHPDDVKFCDIQVPGLSVPSTLRRRLGNLKDGRLVSSPRKGRWRIEQSGQSRIAQ